MLLRAKLSVTTVPAEKGHLCLISEDHSREYRASEERPGCSGFRVPCEDGSRVENTLPIGLVRDFPKERDAWREVDRLGLAVRINALSSPGRLRFNALAERYLVAAFGEDAVRPKSENTAVIVEHIVRDYLITRFGAEPAEDIKPLDIQRWHKLLHNEKQLAWPTIAKMRGIMSRIYKVGILHGRVSENPIEHVETRSISNYRAIVITPEQTLAILRSLLNPLHHALVLTCGATALRALEILALRLSVGGGEDSGFQTLGRR